MDAVPGAASLLLVSGVKYLNEASAVFEAMVEGWSRQQASRRLRDTTIYPRLALIRRFQEFTNEYPWNWKAQDVEDFTVSLMSGERGLSTGTIRGYHLTLRQFCDYLTDRRYD